MPTSLPSRCDPDAPLLDAATRTARLRHVATWSLIEHATALTRTFHFANFHETMAFVSAVAWIAHTQNHHPDLGVHFDRVVVRWSSHDAGGLTDNDFVCARRVDALFDETHNGPAPRHGSK